MFSDSRIQNLIDAIGAAPAAASLAESKAARYATCNSLVLLGDPMQLAQPSQAAHPDGAGASALEHVLGEHATMPEDLGIFIGHTRRMHPDLTAFTSEVFYDGKLKSIDGLEKQRVFGKGELIGSGLRAMAVDHDGNSNSSPEEAQIVSRVVGELLGELWEDPDGRQRKIMAEDVLIVTPFNAQIHEIRKALEQEGYGDVMVGTVDKFQGREAPVTIYSLASSSVELAPRGMEFLYQLNRLNVATSRARCISVIVANPNLVRVMCKTPHQMRLANALCRAREKAKTC